MRKRLAVLALVALPWLACAQSAFDGVWRTDPKTVTAGSKPSQYVVKGGEYRCDSCAPKIRVKADGTQYPLPGNPYIDFICVTIVDDRVVEIISRSGPKVVSTGRLVVSRDGKSMVREISTKEANGSTSRSSEKFARVTPVVKGAHAVTGTWKFTELDNMTEETVTFKTAAGMVYMNASDGTGYEAQLDGKRAPMRNSPGYDTVSLKQKDRNTWEEVSYSADKPIWVSTYVVMPNGETMKVTWEDRLRGSRGTYTMIRQ
jgi:hypothetical protein